MYAIWKTSLRFTLLATALFGVAYPLVVTGVARTLFPNRAAGSLILRNGQVIGSSLLAQEFVSDRYFHPRPSAAGNGYDATDSGGSNLAQSNAALVRRIQSNIDRLSAQNSGHPVPIDMVTTSGSGLDPDITPDAALFQAPRVARACGISPKIVQRLIQQHVTHREFGLLGEPRVNVLELNLALDALRVSAARSTLR